MVKYRKSFWLVVLAVGALAAVAALSALIVRLVHAQAAVIPIAVLTLMILGSGLLIWLALKTLRQLPMQPQSQAPRKQKEQALALFAAQKSQTDRRFSLGLSTFLLILCGVVFLWAYGEAQKTASIPQSSALTGIVFERGKVVSIDEEEYRGQQAVEDVPVGKQVVTVELKSGAYKGQRFRLTNNLSYLYGTLLKEGDRVTVSISTQDGELSEVLLQDYDRTVPLSIVILAFLLVTVLVGGKVGAKSLLGLGLTILCLFAVLIPLLLGGWPTLPTILGMCAFVTVVEFIILGGVNKKTICAILGTVAGVVIAALFGKAACALLRIDGFKMYSAESAVEALLQIKQGQTGMATLQIGDLLVGGILIAALGAVNDVAMSISSAMNELVAVDPELTRKKLFRSGMNIGRDMVGTMTNTLILALVGSSLVLMIYLSSLEPSFSQLMSTTFLSVEVVQAIASSVGVILAVPLSVVIGMVLFAKPKK